MATSDLLKPKKDEEAPIYAIVGSGGIKFTFSSTLYDRQTVESMAIHRAQTLNCSLFRKDSGGKIFQIYPVSGEVMKRGKIQVDVHQEMLNNTQYVPGIQMLLER
jgi:hypothetical protein